MRPNVTDCAMTRLFDALIGGFAQSRESVGGKVAARPTGQDEAVVVYDQWTSIISTSLLCALSIVTIPSVKLPIQMCFKNSLDDFKIQ